MMKKGIFLLGLTGLIFSSCIKHEVIPAPIPRVDLSAHFIGDFNSATVEFTEHVLSYENVATKAKIILPSANSSAIYFSEMSSNEVSTAIKVGMGSVQWNASLSSDPPVSDFNDHFLNEDMPLYSDNGLSGFEVTYTDQFGTEWKSSEASLNAQSVTFTGIEQESDNTGDYSQFICNFNCYIYHYDAVAMELDSIHVQNATYKGWFQR